MNFLFAMLLLVNSGPVFSDPNLREVRSLFIRAASDESACKKLVQMLRPYTEKTNPLLSGYRGNATMMMAKYVFNPISKISHFNRGKSVLENAIRADPENIELLFLRFCTQANSPGFLGYKENMEKDKKMILSNLASVDDPNLKSMIKNYLLKEPSLNEAEKEIVKNIR